MDIIPNPAPSLRRLKRLMGLFVRSKVFPSAAMLFALILTLACFLTWLDKLTNDTNKSVFDAIENKNASLFWTNVAIYVGLFGALSILAMVYRYLEETIGLILRRGLTQFLMENYLKDRAYLRLLNRPDVDNPDQRMTDDVKTLTTNTLSFVLIVFKALLALIVFSHVLRGITPALFWAAAGYAAFGSIITVIIGKRLVGLNFDQLHKEADLRFELVRTREHAEAIALQHDEDRQGPRLLDRLNLVVENMRRIIRRNAYLGLVTSGFNYLAPVVPVLIVAPLVMRGEQSFGAVTQSMQAFQIVVTAFSVLVTNFPQLTLLTAVIARLGELTAAVRTPPKANGLKHEVNGDRLEVRDLLLSDPTDGHQFFAGCRINFRIEPGQHTLIVGRPGSGKSELLRALAGLWATGQGQVIRPPLERVAFVSPQPYLTPSSLRQLLTSNGGTHDASDSELMTILSVLHLDELAKRIGGLDRERDWSTTLSLAERQALALARLLIIRPKFAVLNEATGMLDGGVRRDFYQRLSQLGVTIVTLSARVMLPEFHTQHITLPGGMASAAGPAAA